MISNHFDKADHIGYTVENLKRVFYGGRKMNNNYNVLEEIENLMEQGYSEEHAEEVAMLNNYDIPLEDMFDYN